MNILSGAMVANAMLAIPAAFVGSANAAPDSWSLRYLTAAPAESGFSRGVLPDYAASFPTNVLFPGADADTSSAIREILTSLRYLPAIRRVIEAEDASEAISQFLSSASPAAVTLLFGALQDSEREERRWEFLELLGEAGTADNRDARFENLRSALLSHNAGDRAAAASAMRATGHPLALAVLNKQMARETNSIVKAILKSNLRDYAQNAPVIATAV